MNKILSLIILCAILFAQDSEQANKATSEAVQETQEVETSIEPLAVEVLYESMEKSLGKKNKNLGDVNSDGSVYVIGSATTAIPSNRSGFIASRNVAFSKAVLNAKMEFLKIAGEKVTSGKSVAYIEDLVDGSDPDAVQKASVIKKAKMIADKNLDKALSELGVSPVEIAQMNQSKKNAVYSEKFASEVLSLVGGMLKGVSVVRIVEGESGNNDYQVAVCLKYSPEFQYLATALRKNNGMYYLPKGTPSKSLEKFQNSKGKELISSLGTKVLFNENAAVSTAYSKARLMAVANIKDFVAEELVASEMLSNIEKLEDYADGANTYFSRELWEKSIATKTSSMNIATYKMNQWRTTHPESNQEMVGVVVAWDPAFAKKSKKMDDLLKGRTEKKEEPAKEEKKKGKTKKGRMRIFGSDDDI
jgi:hypothetical protein